MAESSEHRAASRSSPVDSRGDDRTVDDADSRGVGARAADLVERHGRATYDGLKLQPGVEVSIQPQGPALIAFRRALGLAVCLGDPAGPSASLTAAVTAFEADRGPAAFVATLPETRAVYERLGFDALTIAHEAVVRLDRFGGGTAAGYEQRRYDRRFGSGEYSFDWHDPPHSPGLLVELRGVSDAWLRVRFRRERAFVVGSFTAVRVEAMAAATLRDGNGRLLALVTAVSGLPPEIAAIDLMRRDPAAPGGAMDFLLWRVMETARASGRRQVSLGMVPLVGGLVDPAATGMERVLGAAVRRLNPFFSVRGLWRFKEKFQPTWEPRYLTYRNGTPGLVRALAALALVMHTGVERDRALGARRAGPD